MRRALVSLRVGIFAALILAVTSACSVRFNWPRHEVTVRGVFAMPEHPAGVDAHITLSSIELLECRDEDELVRPPGFDFAQRAILGTAHAHGPTTPTRIGSTRVVLLSDDASRPVTLGTWAPNPGSYCSIRITWSAADEDAEGVAVDAHQMLGKTLLVTADGKGVLANTSASADAEIKLSEPLVFGDEEDIKLHVTLTHLADASSVEREDLDEEARGRLILDNLRQSIAAEVSYE